MQKNILTLMAAALMVATVFVSCDKSSEDDQEVLNTDPAACCSGGYVFTTIGTDSVFIPNAFTPNGDGWNDAFNITTTSGFTNISFTVANDTGLVFSYSGNGYYYWDGSNNVFGDGEELAEGTYNYTFIGTSANGNTDTITGKVCLLKMGDFCPQSKSSCILPSHFSSFNTATGIDSTGQTQYEPPFCN